MQKTKALVLGLVAVVGLLGAVQAQAFSGSGSSDDPYLITNCTELQSLNGLGGSSYQNVYWLDNDFDCGSDTNNSGGSLWNGGSGFQPIYDFQGTLDGRGYTISNLYINRPSEDMVALFNSNYVGSFYNLVLSNVDITGGETGAASLVGSFAGNGSIKNVQASGDVAGGFYVGGLVGTSFSDATATISRSSFSGTIVSTFGGGGLVGRARGNLDIVDSFASTTHVGVQGVGGLIGFGGDGSGIMTIVRSYANGNVSGTSGGGWAYSGGLVGFLDNKNMTISNSFATVAVSGTSVNGALVGKAMGNSTLNINYTYFDAALAGTSNSVASVDIGAVVNDDSASVAGLYANLQSNSTYAPLDEWTFPGTWSTSANLPIPSAASSQYSGPSAPQDYSATIVSGNSIQMSWTAPASLGSEPLKTYPYRVEFKKHSEADWSDNSPSYNYSEQTETTWSMSNLDLSTEYDVRVRAVTNYGGSAWLSSTLTTRDALVFSIDTCQKLADMASVGSNYDTYNITTDLDCSDTAASNPTAAYCDDDSYTNETDCETNDCYWYPAKNSGFAPITWLDGEGYDLGFKGTLNGQGHIITGLTINRPDKYSVGIFKVLGNGAIVKDFTLSGGSITGSGEAGAIAGYAYDGVTIQDIISSVNVSDFSYYADGNYNNGSDVGGLIGYYGNDDYAGNLTLTNNQISGTISGVARLGGLVGRYVASTNEENETSTVIITGNTVSGDIITTKQTEEENIDDYIEGEEIGGLFGEYQYVVYDDMATHNLTVSNNTIESTVSLEGISEIGGLFGYVEFYNDGYDDSTVNADFGPNNAVLSDINAQGSKIGGLIGELEAGMPYDSDVVNMRIFESFVDADIYANDNSVGGLVGSYTIYVDDDNDSGLLVSDSYYNGNVVGLNYVGGLIGYTYDENGDEQTLWISRSYASGSITASEYAGGLLGYIYTMTNVNDSFAANVISADSYYGSVFGYDYMGDLTASNTYYDDDKNDGMSCLDDDSLDGCEAVNVEGSDPDYFFDNSGNEPFDDSDWHFSTVWKTNATSYPTLEFYVPASVTEVWVDDDYESGSDGGHNWGTDAFDNIPDAVDAVAENGTIHVAAGTYNLASTLVLNKSVNLTGPGIDGVIEEDRANVTMSGANCSGSRKLLVMLSIEAADVNVSGFEIGSDCNQAPVVRVGPSTNPVEGVVSVENVVIDDNEISGGEHGVSVRHDTAATTISNNIIHGANNVGNHTWGKGGITLGSSPDNQIFGNNIYENYNGITMYYGGEEDWNDGQFGGTDIYANEIRNNAANGIYFSAGDQADSVNIGPDNNIHDNSDGIYIDGNANDLHINGNQIFDNTNQQSGLHIDGATTGLDATVNWWGADESGESTGPKEENYNPDGNGDTITIIESDITRIYYRPFCIDEDCEELSSKTVTSDNISVLFNDGGSITIPNGSSSDSTSELNVNEETVIKIAIDGHNHAIVLPRGTVIKMSDGGNFDAADLDAANIALSELSGFAIDETLLGAIQWGLPNLGLKFENADGNPAPITIHLYVGTNLSGQELVIKRSASASENWTDDGIVAPGTCTVSAEGFCSFGTTKASYFVVLDGSIPTPVVVLDGSIPTPDDEDEAQKAHIDSWKAIEYAKPDAKCVQRVKLNIEGKHFAKGAEVRIGGKEAFDVNRKSSKEITAKFCLEKLLNVKTDLKRTISVTNPDADIEKADKEIDLADFIGATGVIDSIQNNSEWVKGIQNSLVKLGYLDQQYVTGIFGPITTEAVKKFQADNGIEQTGTVGPLTKAKLVEKMQ